MNDINSFIIRVKTYLAKTGFSKSYFGKISCGNSEAVKRLFEKQSISLKTAASISSFMDKNPELKRYDRQTKNVINREKINNRTSARNGNNNSRERQKIHGQQKRIQNADQASDSQDTPLACSKRAGGEECSKTPDEASSDNIGR